MIVQFLDNRLGFSTLPRDGERTKTMDLPCRLVARTRPPLTPPRVQLQDLLLSIRWSSILDRTRS